MGRGWAKVRRDELGDPRWETQLTLDAETENTTRNIIHEEILFTKVW